MEAQQKMHDLGTPRAPSRDAIVAAANRLFLEKGFGAVSMDELAAEAGVARRTLYNQFANKEEIFREMLRRISVQLEHAYPPGFETKGDLETILRMVVRMTLELHKKRDYVGFLRMVVADSRQFPWIAEAFAAVMDPQAERLVKLFKRLKNTRVLNCRNPTLAAHQFMGAMHFVSLWPRIMGRDRIAVTDDELIEETIGLFMTAYRTAPDTSRKRRGAA